ncbi:ankyrin repeat domain-containing protein [Wolbachia endosymbiont of Frankliniella intonsa]|uniref:ankyrin repeat domain-containing protein n=1 Tax=Wolbachia endosymbiont of Frankliniella intonsa TaxID=2902422 RepID=UPI00244EB328|nr:ankyrin repeat domain-containing protein [Wolbachia endosymbiont of Frankliniella intonsa]WGJ62762.1 ankyrin repeat domain-containing protein [Wolbachia endosymbiont of Frankliniella intonsa]
MTLDDFLKMLEEINDTSGLSKNNIVERIKMKLERIDLRSWKDSGFNINHIFTTHSDLDPVETTLLHFAAKSGYENVVRALIACEADVNARDWDRCTPLHFAAEWNHKGILDILIESEANVNACDNDGYTPLHFAAEGGNESAVGALIASEANVNAQNNDGHTPLHFATKSGYENIVIALIEHGACVNVWDSCGRTPLHFASDHESIRDILIQSVAYVSKQNNNRYAPLHFAIEWGCKDVISSLSGNASPRAEMAVGRVEQITIAERLKFF